MGVVETALERNKRAQNVLRTLCEILELCGNILQNCSELAILI